MLLNMRGTASIVFLVMMHARLRGWCSVCDNTAAVMLGVSKGTYVRCSQSRAGFISPRLPTSFVLASGFTAHSSPCVSPNARNALWVMTEITPDHYTVINALRRIRCRVWPDAKAGAWRRVGPECLDGC